MAKNKQFDIKEFIQEFRKYLIQKYGMKWKRTYIPFKLLENYTEYYMMLGERSDGKTYIVLEMILYLYLKYGFTGALIRRWETDIKGATGLSLIKNLIGTNQIVIERTKGKWDNAVQEMSNGKFDTIVYKSRCYYLGKSTINENGKRETICEQNPFLNVFALSQEEHNKGGGFESIKIILFDEIISRDSYLIDEFVAYMNTLSTIIRRRDDVTIFMCGNTINRYSPYFDEMGLKHVKNQQSGTIDTYEYIHEDPESHEKTISHLQVELIDYVSKEHKKSNKYFCFDNPKIKMITDGKWEMSIYPRCPNHYLPKDVKYRYFIIFDNEKFMCEIVLLRDNTFTFIHPHTKDIKIKNDTLIFDLNGEINPHIRKRITKPFDELGKLIASYFTKDLVCYSSNAVGESIRNYIEQCAL